MQALSALSRWLIIPFLATALVACSDDDDDGGDEPVPEVLGSVSGTVIDYYTGEPVSGATVRISAGEDGSLLAEVATGDDGAYSADDLALSARLVVAAEAEGYSADAVTVATTTDAPDAVAESLELLAAHLVEDFDPATARDFVVEGETLLSLPADALVDADGQPASGSVTATLTILDPSGDTDVMPGALETLTDDGSTAPIESFGALDVRFVDADGAPLQLAEGSSATISIPLASGTRASQAPESIPLYWYDETAGYWVEEGSAALTQTDAGWVYLGTVAHFTTWNADQTYDTILINGCVQDGDGVAVSGASVFSDGIDYSGSASTLSDANGGFSVPARIESQVLVAATAGAGSQTLSVATGSEDLTLDQCLVLAPTAASIKLTWGENPSDLDSHFLGPQSDSDAEFHVYYGNQTVTVDGTIFSLDVDDTSSFGPEVITAFDFPLAGTYRYVVHLFSGSSTIADSPARVELNLQGDTTIFSPANAGGDPAAEYWHVFDLIVDDAGTATLQLVQQFSNSLDPVDGEVSARALMQPMLLPLATDAVTSPARTALERKYYADGGATP